MIEFEKLVVFDLVLILVLIVILAIWLDKHCYVETGKKVMNKNVYLERFYAEGISTDFYRYLKESVDTIDDLYNLTAEELATYWIVYCVTHNKV